jgi:hypothetical protein
MKIFYILSIILLTSFTVSAQQPRNPVTDPDAKLVKFYPNPAVSQITFSFERGYDKNLSLQVFNFIGKKVYEIQNVAPKNTVDLNEFYRGVYIFQLRDKSGKIIESGKFQVAK